MGSNHSLRDGPDSVDVLAVLVAFEELNQCYIEVKGQVEYWEHSAAMVWSAAAYTKPDAGAEPVRLGYRKLSHGFSNPLKMEAVILQLLYGLDAALERRDFALADKKA